MYNLVCLIGESGSGKDTVLKKVLEGCKTHNLKFNKVVGCTTRPMRENEVDGINYHYLTIDQFSDKVINGDMIEATNFNDWFYGTEMSALKDDKVNIGIFNPQSIYDIIETTGNIKLWVYYIEASGKTRLLRQLNREKNPDVEEILRRYHADEDDFYILDFSYNILKNENLEDLDKAVDTLLNDIYTIQLTHLKN